MRGIWISLSILLLLALVFLLVPAWLQVMAAGVLLAGLGLSIVRIVRDQVLQFRLGGTDGRIAIRNGLLAVLRMLLSLGLALTLARPVAVYVIDHLAGLWGFITAIGAAMAVGMLVNMIVRRAFDLAAAGINRLQ